MTYHLMFLLPKGIEFFEHLIKNDGSLSLVIGIGRLKAKSLIILRLKEGGQNINLGGESP